MRSTLARVGTLMLCIGFCGACEASTSQLTAPSGRAPQSALVVVPHKYVQVDAGVFHTCGVTAVGSVECWGDAPFNAAPATRSATDGAFTAVSASALHTCALTTAGTAECWGSNGEGRAPATRSAASGVYTELSSGLEFTCGLRSDGAVECWGYLAHLTGNEEETVYTMSAASGRFVQFSAGDYHYCAVTSTGVVECHGYDGYGQAPAVRAAAAGTFTQVAAGVQHTCALTTAGAIECWGAVPYSELLVGRIATTGQFTQVSAGYQHTCAVTTAGTLECWGQPFRYGDVPVRTPAAGGAFVQVSAGHGHTCARSDLGIVECWGDVGYGNALSTPPTDLAHVAPAATFVAPTEPIVVGTSFTLSLPGAAVPGHPEFVGFTYAFDCGDGQGYGAAASLRERACPADAAGSRTVRGRVIDSDGDASEYAATVVVAKVAQTLEFTSAAPASAYLGATYSFTAAATSGLPVVSTTLTPATCTVSGRTVTFAAVGVCEIAADQPGDATYEAAPRRTQRVTVVWPFTGFYSPLVNPPAALSAAAGRAIPVKFSLGGDRGLRVLAAGSPGSANAACGGAAVEAPSESTTTAESGLTYDAASGVYTYVWKTDKAWAGSCRRFVLKLADGTEHSASINFK